MNDSELISLEECARRIGRRRKTLYNWRHRGELGYSEGVRVVKGRILIDWGIFRRRVVDARKAL